MNDRQCLTTVLSLRRQIHQYPELGHQEFKTTALVEKTLGSTKISFKRHRPTGVVGILKGRPGPCVALRADMDALPLEERTAVSFRSRNRGVMHACGHDAHTAMVLTAALCLAEEAKKNPLPGTVKFIFQPDEEGSGGAQKLIREGALRDPRVDAVFGLHVNPRVSAGHLGIKSGPLMAAVDQFTLTIWGQGGHGAYPHEGRDAIVMASQVVMALQTLVSRRVDPVEPVVLTVGTIRGGDRFNILAEKVVLEGTVRTLSEEWHRKMPELIKETVTGLMGAFGGRYHLDYKRIGKPVVNDAAMADIARLAARSVVGSKRVVELDRPSMGGEDFSEYMEHIPGCFVYLGTGRDKQSRRPWHHPDFFLHEPSLGVGVKFLCALVRESLRRFAC
jgi:amidohydrolase